MVITNNELLTWSRVPNAKRVVVTAELFPGGLSDLNDYSLDDIRDAIKSFRTHPTVNQRFNLTPYTMKRLTQLTLWVKDKVRIGHAATFPDTTTNVQFSFALEEAQQREKIRQERKKNAEGLATLKIDPALKSSAGWDAWIDAAKAALSVAYGSKGVPLLYVIRKYDAPRVVFDDVDEMGNIIVPTWEELAIDSAPLSGLDYEADRKTVHLFILNNVAEDSDAHAYIYPLVSKNNGRRDWNALKERYDNEATVQARVNQANKTWDLLVYKNERAMPFEAFCRKLTKSLQHFQKAGRSKHDGDVIDWIWAHVQNAELAQHLSALKVAQSYHLKTSREILQEIAKEIPNISKGSNFQPRISEIQQTGAGDFTFDGDTPSHGARTADGKLFCGMYNSKQWFSNDVKPFRDQIIALREKHGKGSNKNQGDGRANQVRDAKRKLQALEKKNEELARNISQLKSGAEGDGPKVEAPDLEGNSNAGEAFGGRNSMKQERK